MVEEYNFYNENAANALGIVTDVISGVASRTSAGAVIPINLCRVFLVLGLLPSFQLNNPKIFIDF